MDKEFFDESSNLKGLLSEKLVELKLIQYGFSIYSPANHHDRTDLIVKDKNGKLLKIQVKFAKKQESFITVDLVKKSRSAGGKQYTSSYTSIDVDYFIAVELESESLYLLDFDLVKDCSRISLFLSKTDGKLFHEDFLIENFLDDFGIFGLSKEIKTYKTASIKEPYKHKSASGYIGVQRETRARRNNLWVAAVYNKRLGLNAILATGNDPKELAEIYDRYIVDNNLDLRTNKSKGLL